jgi:large subunit ribosomal protein L10
MPMNRNQKAAVIEEISQQLEGYPAIYLTNASGLTVEQSNKLRRAFQAAGVEFKVYKNTFVRLAMEERGGYEQVLDRLNGPTAVALSTDPAKPAKVIKQFLKDNDLTLPELKGAWIDGAVYDENALETLTNIKGKDELLGDVVALLLSPMQNIVGGLTGVGSTLGAIVQTLAERDEA